MTPKSSPYSNLKERRNNAVNGMIYTISIFATIFFLYILLLKVLPFVLYPNYLLPGKVERYPAIVALALELRGKDKRETLENAFAYLREHHASNDKIWKWKNLSTLFLVGDFSTEPYFDRECFLWCHTKALHEIPPPIVSENRSQFAG